MLLHLFSNLTVLLPVPCPDKEQGYKNEYEEINEYEYEEMGKTVDLQRTEYPPQEVSRWLNKPKNHYLK